MVIKMYYLNYFFLYSIIGHVLESLFIFLKGSNGESGYLYGPWTPVYGIGIILIIIISNFVFKNIKKNKIIQSIIIFLWVSIALSIIEWLGGITIEHFFHFSFWNYSKLALSIGKYVAVEVAAIWGILSLVFIYLLKNPSDKFVKLIPKWLTYILVVLFIIDNIFSILKYIK